MSKSISAVVTKMVSELESLNSDEERERAIAGARAILGMAGTQPPTNVDTANAGVAYTANNGTGLEGISTTGAAWLRRVGLTKDDLERHFHMEDGKVKLIGDAIGNKKREQSINTYLLTGVAALLETGKPDFTDQAARDYCTQFGCYDSANHAGTVGQFGNKLTGSKKAGWKVTAPGLSVVAALLKPAAKESK